MAAAKASAFQATSNPPLEHPTSDAELTDALISCGLLSRLDARRIEHLRASVGMQLSLPVLLVDYGLTAPDDLAVTLSRLLDSELAEKEQLAIADRELCGDLSLRFLQQHVVTPIARSGATLIVATADPRDRYPAGAVALATDMTVEARIASVSDIREHLDKIANEQRVSEGVPLDEIDHHGGALSETEADQLRDLASGAPVIRLVNEIVSDAAGRDASDIHIEPQRDGCRIRFRIDGELEEATRYPDDLLAPAVSRIKIMAHLDIAERRLPQDGRCQQKINGADFDLRVATAPTMYGESVVVRLLDQASTLRELDDLGFDENNAQAVYSALRCPNGMVLLTGPTGSGKTTTLYAALSRLNDGKRKIITIEDPVEYQLAGISQIPTKASIGLDFARALRSVVRQDPDIIMVGEMRDGETARICVQSALTGHLVLSTLHTNSAVESVVRLRDMGIEDYLLASTLRLVVAQRLVRRLCPHCREPYRPNDVLVSQLAAIDLGPGLYRAAGCEHCTNGYRGRLPLHECLFLGDELRAMIAAGAKGGDLHSAAIAQGMMVMRADGLKKAAAGLTTIEEVARVIEE